MGTSLPEELHLEILRRLSPTPKVLARASAVCREWRRVVNHDPGFLRELYRARRGAPVTAGFFHNANKDEYEYPHRFVHVDADDRVKISVECIDRTDDWQFVDCRHGRVLLKHRWNHRFLLWHPVTGVRHLVLDTPSFGAPHKTSVTLICDRDAVAAGVGRDDADKQLDKPTSCHASHFCLAVVYNHWHSGCLLATVYSSVTRLWSSPLELPRPIHQIRPDPCAVVGKSLYQPLCDYTVLAYDIERRILTTFERPKCGNIRLFKADGHVLGLLGVLGFTLRLWARYADAWVMQRTIDLSQILPGLSTAPSPCSDPRFNLMPPVKIIGVDDQGDVLFMWTMIGIFMLCPETMEVKKMHDTAPYMTTVYPYGDFYLPPSARSLKAAT